MNIISFDVGGTEIKYSIYDEENFEHLNGNIDTPVQGTGETIKVIKGIIKTYQEKYNLKGIAFSLPGAVEENGSINWMGAVTDLGNLNIVDEFKNTFNLEVYAGNDANCFAIAEHNLGKGRGYKNTITYTIGTGVGAGIIIDNKLYTGNKCFAGEIGLMPLMRITNAYEQEEYCFSNYGSSRSLLYRAQQGWLDAKNVKEIFDEYEKGTHAAVRTVNMTFENIAMGTLNLIVTLAPDVIIIGGGITKNDNFLPLLMEKLTNIFPDWDKFTKIDTSHFGNDSGKIGASLGWFEKYGG